MPGLDARSSRLPAEARERGRPEHSSVYEQGQGGIYPVRWNVCHSQTLPFPFSLFHFLHLYLFLLLHNAYAISFISPPFTPRLPLSGRCALQITYLLTYFPFSSVPLCSLSFHFQLISIDIFLQIESITVDV